MIYHEVHIKGKIDFWSPDYTLHGCGCSYCKGENKMHFGLNIPKNKSKTSWWVIKYWSRRYIRFTMSNYFKRSNECLKS